MNKRKPGIHIFPKSKDFLEAFTEIYTLENIGSERIRIKFIKFLNYYLSTTEAINKEEKIKLIEDIKKLF